MRTLANRSGALLVLLSAIAFAAGCDSPKPAPTITSVAPTELCAEGGMVTVTGTDFQDGAVVRLGADATTSIATTFVSATMLTFDSGMQEPGTYDVVVENPDAQSATLADAITFFAEPIVFFVDPPTVWNGLAIEATIYASDVHGDVQSVEIAPTGTSTRQALDGVMQDPAHPSRIQASLPSGLAAGAYDVYITDETCEAVLVSAFEVVQDTELALVAVDPPFGWSGGDTAVTITADTSGAAGFSPTPRVYLSPSGGGLAVAGRAVAVQDESTLSAIVPEGLAPGPYDVIVIDPAGTVGVLTSGFLVTADPPPTIEDATPGQIDSGTATSITLRGSGFAAGAMVRLSCVDALGVPLAESTITPTSVAPAGDELAFTTPALDAGTVCVLRVSNADGTYGDFSAISVTNPASNLEPFQSSATAPDRIRPLTTGRRGLALVAGRVSQTQRYLFAIGGDDGTVAGALDTVESTQIDLFGNMVGWQPQAQGASARTMTTPRTGFGAVRIGQYLYAAGGSDGTTALATIERARILDPLQVPELDDIDITLDSGSGLEPGSWVYRIAAVTSPDGESLPSEPINVTIPTLDDATQHIQVTVSWTAVPGATAYRVYRTRAPGDPAADVAFLGEVTDASFLDDGAEAPATDALPPLAIGALGAWHEVGTMSAGRAGAAVAAARGATENDWFLYVGGGHDGTGVLDTYELLPVTIDPTDASQDVGTLALGSRTIGAARWHLAAWTVDATSVASAGTDSFVYFGVGETADGTAQVRATVAGRVDPATGELVSGDTAALDDVSPSANSGVAAVTSSGFLYELGGGPTPIAGGFTSEVCRPGLAGCAMPSPPTIRPWNSLGSGGVLVPRYLPSAALESAFIFVAGGTSTGTDALTSVERTIR